MPNRNQQILSPRDRGILHLIVADYYKVVERRLETYCVMNAAILERALRALGVTPVVKPCQLIYCTPTTQYIVGFSGIVQPGQWDGHLAVRAGDLLIDPSIRTFHKHFGLNLPHIVGTNKVQARSNLIATLKIDETSRLLWMHPPADAELNVPEQPAHVIDKFATALVDHVRERVDHGLENKGHRTCSPEGVQA